MMNKFLSVTAATIMLAFVIGCNSPVSSVPTGDGVYTVGDTIIVIKDYDDYGYGDYDYDCGE